MADKIVEGKRAEIEPGVFSLSFEDKAGLYMLYRSARMVGLAPPTILDLLDAATGWVDTGCSSHIADQAGKETLPTTPQTAKEDKALAAAKAGKKAVKVEPVYVEPLTVEIPTAVAPVVVPEVVPEVVPTPEPVVEAPPPEVVPVVEAAPPVVEEPVAPAVEVSKEKLMSAMKTLIMVDKTAVSDILARNGAKCMSELLPAQYPKVWGMVQDALSA